MRKNPARGPEDLFDPDNIDVSSFMADYGHNFKPSNSTSSGSARWAFSFKKSLTALVVIAILGALSTIIWVFLIVGAIIFA